MAYDRSHSSADEESQPLTEDSLVFSADAPGSPDHRRSSSSVSTTSLALEHLNGPGLAKKKELRFRDDEDDNFRRSFEVLDIEEGPLLQGGRAADSKYKRWLWILGTICAVGWCAAFILFVTNGAYKHRSSLEHDPDATSSVGHGKHVTIDQLQSGQWIPKSHGISWIASPDGTDGMMLEQGGENGKDYLVVEDVRNWGRTSGENRTISLMKQRGFEVGTSSVYPAQVWPSPDFKMVLVASDTRHNWRHSFTGRYWLFDVESQKATPLDPAAPDGRIQLATWSPNSDAVVFTRDNNMFIRHGVKDSALAAVAQITADGGAEMFNGVPDWVYEEEVFSGNSATWWSPDGRYLAYLVTDEHEVPEYPVQYFLSRPSGSRPAKGLENYPEVRQIKYPKAGAPNPIVHIRFYDVEKNSKFDVPIEDDFPDPDRLITEVIWAGSTGKVLVRETNRESDLLKMVLIDVERRSGKIVRTEDVNALDGGWFEISETTTYVPSDPANGRPHDGYIDTVIHEGYDHLGYFSPIDSSEPTMLTTGKWEVVAAPSAVDLTTNSVYFTATIEESTQRHDYRVSLDGSGLEAITDISKQGYHEVSYSTGAGYALVSYQGPRVPWQKVISTPSVKAESFSHTIEENEKLSEMASAYEMPLLQYSTVNIDGYELNVVERRPPHFDSRSRYPVLFYLYGGPGSQTVDKRFSVNFQSYVAATLGYIVVTVDGRGTGFIGREARCIVRGNLGYWEAHDQIETAKEWAKRDYVDANRMAIWGWSYGGYMTLKTLEQDAGQTFHYGMAVAPVTDWQFYDSIYTERWMHTPQHNMEGYMNASVSNATALGQNTRFLMMHGVADDNVHLQNSLTLLDALDMAGVENYDFHAFPDSDHSIYFHNANRMVYDKLNWWLINAFNGEWAKIRKAVPLKKGQQVGT